MNSNPFLLEQEELKNRQRQLLQKRRQAKIINLVAMILIMPLLATSIFMAKNYQCRASSQTEDQIIALAQVKADNIKSSSDSQCKKTITEAEAKAIEIKSVAKAKAAAEAKAKAEAEAKKLRSSKKGSVALSFPIKLSSYELDLLYRIVYAEAGNQSTTGQQAVCWTILNRLADSRFPSTITGIINAPGQFDPVRNGSINNNSSQKTKDAVDAVLAGKVEDMTYGAQYFCDPSISSKKAMKWFNTLECTTTIGCHSFYKD